MKFALIGKSIAHSLSPKLYKDIFGSDLQYDLLDIEREVDLPSLEELSKIYDGINITSPYKKSYLSQVEIDSPEVFKLGAINTIAFTASGPVATNTDLIAVKEKLRDFKTSYPGLHLTILGSGVMGTLTEIVAEELKIPFETLDRKRGLSHQSDLTAFHKGSGHLIINACSRGFIFEGKAHAESMFWDYNYNLIPHQDTLPSRFKLYLDGQEMLQIQAQAAAQFWLRTNPKLKC